MLLVDVTSTHLTRILHGCHWWHLLLEVVESLFDMCWSVAYVSAYAKKKNYLQHYVTSFPPIGVTAVMTTGGAADWLTYARSRSAEAQSKAVALLRRANLCQMKRQSHLCAVIFKSSLAMRINASLER